MSQSQQLIEALKQSLKRQRLSYADVANHLGVSESSVKRAFSRGSFTLGRLEAICELAGVDFLELARLAEEARHRVVALTEAQEAEVVSDPQLLLVAICALNRWRFEDIIANYQISELELIRRLAHLDELGFLELLPGNRIKLRVARNFAWLPNGPIQQYFVRNVQGDFLAGEFQPGRDVHRFTWGMLSAESTALLRERITALIETFNDRSRSDEVRHQDSQSGTCLLVALRDWEPTGFQAMRRNAPE